MSADTGVARPRLAVVNRRQLVMRAMGVELLIAEDHPARAIWELVARLDLSRYHADIGAAACGAATPEPFGGGGAQGEANAEREKRGSRPFCGARNLSFARSLNPSLQTFDQWLAQNKSRIPLE